VLEAHHKSATDAAVAALSAPADDSPRTHPDQDGLPVFTVAELRAAGDRIRREQQLMAQMGSSMRRMHLAWRQQASHRQLCQLRRQISSSLEAQEAYAEAVHELAQDRPACTRRAAPPPQRHLSTLLASSLRRNAPNLCASTQIRSRRTLT
jgi:hypothetical protein